MSIWTVQTRALRMRKAMTSRLQDLMSFGGALKGRHIPKIEPAANRSQEIGIGAIVKNERDYIGEWMQFHILQGVTTFIIYDNGCTDDTLEVAQRYAKGARCVVIPWRNFVLAGEHVFTIQSLAYAHAMCNFGSTLRWMAFIDVDEFLYSPAGKTLAEVLANLSNVPAVSVPWTNFGFNGHETKPAGLVIENYTECAAHPLHPKQRTLLRYKSIVDPVRIDATGSHFFPLREFGEDVFNARGERTTKFDANSPEFVSTEVLRLNHYFTRSREEMKSRVAKGRVSKNGQEVQKYLDRRLAAYDVQKARDEAILQYVPELKRRMQSIEAGT